MKMKILSTEIPSNHNYVDPPRWWRELNAQRATAIDADKRQILAKHWPGLLIVNGKLAVTDDSNSVLRKWEADCD